jgi:hypothetical protein
MHAIHPAHLIILDVITLMFSVERKSLCYLLQLPAISCLLGTYILLRALLTKSLVNFCFFFLIMKDQLSHSYNITDKVIFLRSVMLLI